MQVLYYRLTNDNFLIHFQLLRRTKEGIKMQMQVVTALLRNLGVHYTFKTYDWLAAIRK